jgi:hypothetical protein
MIWIAIATHLLLSAGLLWASWQVWAFRMALRETVETVDGWTEACENGLQVSTPSLVVTRGGVGATRKQYQLLQNQVEKIRQLLSILSRGVSFLGSRWQQARKGLKVSPNSLNKKTNGKSSDGKSSGSKNNVKRRG